MKMSCIKSDDVTIPAMFRPFALKMEERGMPSIVINVFKCYYAQLVYGSQGKLMDKEITPVEPEELKSWEQLEEYADRGREAMSKACIIKLNGGLGTSMGLEKAKSLIPVKDGLTFLDIIQRQTMKLREKYNTEIPLVFMNSFKTHMDTMLRTEGFDNGDTGVPLAFVQHRYPKILEKNYAPAEWPENPELEWNPPGHGDIYTALVTSKLLTTLLVQGFKYAFISNSDNLGALMDERILGYMDKEKLPFVMEVARRTPVDKKGGHLARRVSDGRLVLREVAQCPRSELESFSDIDKYRFFNTNSLWLDLRALENVFVSHHMMPLDLIINPKNLDPRNPESPPVLQIETAMGAALSSFANATAVVVPRSRFAPVKTTNDLMIIMSDCYVRSPEEAVIPNPDRTLPLQPRVDLDVKYYKKIDDFFSRFPRNVPSLIECESLQVAGDVRFDKGVEIKGKVRVENPGYSQAVIPAGTVVDKDLSLER